MPYDDYQAQAIARLKRHEQNNAVRDEYDDGALPYIHISNHSFVTCVTRPTDGPFLTGEKKC
jgi:hypothetical protein